ncbi:MAG: 50S ribosomal protein L4 [Patescibacteria group bacterium]
MEKKELKKKLKETPKSNTSEEKLTKTENVFDFPVNKDLLSLYVRVFRANARQGTSSTKTKGEVSGGGKKPWRQKGTGRARQGSIRSPQWVHGGISHGPKPKDWSLTLSPRFKKESLKSALALKSLQKNIRILESFNINEGKTKDFIKILKENQLTGSSLFITPKYNAKFYKAGRNVRGVEIASSETVNPYEILKAKTLVLVADSVKALKDRI